MQDLEKFEQLTKQQIRSVNPRFEASLDEARAFVRVLCMGMGTFDCSSRVVQPQAQGNVGNAMTPVLVVKNCKLFGDFATRSRIPFNVVSDPAMMKWLSRHYARPVVGLEEKPFPSLEYGWPGAEQPTYRGLSIPLQMPRALLWPCEPQYPGAKLGAERLDGQPLGGAWAQVVLEADGQLLSLDAAPQVFAQEVSLAQFRGKPVVLVPKNDVSSVKLRGAVAVLSEKHKPGTMSDGALLRGAYQAGAEAVIKIGGGGAMLYCVPDPSEIPCFAISEDDGKKLCSALEVLIGLWAGGRVTVKELIVHDRREKLQAERWKCGNVWLHVSGLYLQSVDWDGPLWEVAQEARAAQEALIYEDYFEAYQDTREVDPRLGLERSKLRRMMESAWSQLGRIGLTKNASMIGKLLALGAQRCKLKVNYLKFHPAETFTGTACAMLLSPHKPGFKQKPASDSLVQAWVAHEAVYLALMGHFTKLIDYMAPSLWNLIKCMNGEFFGWEADASKIRKLFTACTGPFGPVPRELWQQRDPTWRITDERNAVGMVVRTQGRLLWSKDATAAPMRTVLPKRSGPSGPTRPMLDFMSRMAQKLCCTL
ncbi:unnamed protein product [Durusdinium trenchii]|uniref:Uncharacterized protein n=1 Tax=Durusdinium trenchii TaxID=1381693 RepID=A0ABP0RN68_9DINO